jgi:hypothetical protein
LATLAGTCPFRAAETLEFGLVGILQSLRFVYPGDVDSRYTQLMFKVIERSYRYVHGGFRVGISDLSQSGNPPTDGLAIGGGSVGFVLRSQVPLGAGLGLYAQGTYDYHTVDGSTESDAGSQSVSLDWFDFTARGGLSARLEPLILRAGPYYRHVDGDERARGDIDRTLALQAREATGGFVDLIYVVDRTGWLGLRLERGSRNGASLNFTRLFD